MFNLNDKVVTKKVHACGGREWTIVRVGADYKIKCNQCGRTLLLSVDKLKKMIKEK